MKNIYLTLILTAMLVFGAGQVSAQQSEWFATGNTWTYNFHLALDFFDNTYQANYAITEQTEFAGRACAKMDYAGGSEMPFDDSENAFLCMAVQPPYYFYTSGDSVFYASENDGEFHLAYDMGAQIGDTWEFVVPVKEHEVPGVFVDTFIAEVLDASIVTVDGQSLRRLTLEYSYAGDGDPHTALEGYGEVTVTEYLGADKGFFLPFGDASVVTVCEGEINVVLQCYSSEALDYLNPAFDSCVLGLADVPEGPQLSLFPNPAGTKATLYTRGLIGERIEIFDVRGRSVYATAVTGPETELDVSVLAPGMYVVRIADSDAMKAKLRVVR